MPKAKQVKTNIKSEAHQNDLQYDSDGKKEGKQKQIPIWFSANQLTILEGEFAINRYLTRPRRYLIAQRLGVEELKVRTWFAHRRMKNKRNPTADDSLSQFRPGSAASSIASQESESSSVSASQYEIESMINGYVANADTQENIAVKQVVLPNQKQWTHLQHEPGISLNQGSMTLWHHGNINNSTNAHQVHQSEHNPQLMHYGQQQNYEPHCQHHEAAYPDVLVGIPNCNDMYTRNSVQNFAPNRGFCQEQHYGSQEEPQPVNKWSQVTNYSFDYYEQEFWDELLNSVE